MASGRRIFLHPLHGLLLAFPIALFAGALASDITYLRTAVVQWSHFSAWLLAGAQVFGTLVLAWAVVNFLRFRSGGLRGRATAYLVFVAAMWIAGLVNSFHHSRDAWSSVGTFGLLLSIVSTVLAFVAGWIAHSASAATGGIR